MCPKYSNIEVCKNMNIFDQSILGYRGLVLSTFHLIPSFFSIMHASHYIVPRGLPKESPNVS